MTGLRPEQIALIERLRLVLEDDERVISAWLGGSIGRGEGDAFSDIDITLAVEEEDLAACVAEYSGRRNPVGPSVLQSVQFSRVVCNTTPEMERYDLLFLLPIEFRNQDPAKLTPLVRATRPPEGNTPSFRMPAPQLVATVTEFLRIIGLLHVGSGREEWLVAIEGISLMRKMTIDLMVEDNGLTSSRGGVKRLNAFLTPEQRQALEAIVAVAPTREGVIQGSLEMAALFLPLARDLVAKAGGEWPDALETATRAHLLRTVGVTF